MTVKIIHVSTIQLVGIANYSASFPNYIIKYQNYSSRRIVSLYIYIYIVTILNES